MTPEQIRSVIQQVAAAWMAGDEGFSSLSRLKAETFCCLLTKGNRVKRFCPNVRDESLGMPP
jgi:hypothetical protein